MKRCVVITSVIMFMLLLVSCGPKVNVDVSSYEYFKTEAQSLSNAKSLDDLISIEKAVDIKFDDDKYLDLDDDSFEKFMDEYDRIIDLDIPSAANVLGCFKEYEEWTLDFYKTDDADEDDEEDSDDTEFLGGL